MKEGKIRVEYVAHMGTDMMPVNAAKISRGKENPSEEVVTEKDIKLMDFLAKHQHLTPFEHQTLCVIVHCPLYIRSQIHRHRTFSYNEISRRYTSEDIEFYIPDDFHMQGLKDKQMSGQKHEIYLNLKLKDAFIKQCDEAESNYNVLLERDVAREEARGILPQNLMTKFYMTGNLRNWVHFLELRMDDHAQYESQLVAKAVFKIAVQHFPETMKVLMKYTQVGNAKAVNEILSGQDPTEVKQ